jgi:transketolase C-terminal domain/subunit
LKLSPSVGHAEGVTAITATKLQLPVPPIQQFNAMTRHHAQQRMPHLLQSLRVKQKRMTAMTSILRQTAAFRHLMNKVPEPAAAVSDKLAEAFLASVGRGFPLEQQRVAAVSANVFTMARALAYLRIRVAAQETRHIMPYMRRCSVSA